MRRDLSDDGVHSSNDESANEHVIEDECSICEEMLDNEPPIYLGRYTSKVKNSKNKVEDSDLLTFHTATGENALALHVGY